MTEKTSEPKQYAKGYTTFLGCHVDLTHKPFIPRPETAFWVAKAIQDIKKHAGRVRCLDLCAGSGCIGVAVLKHCPNVVVDFAERNPRFLKQIAVNCQKNSIDKKRYHIIDSNLFNVIAGRYDYILTNPPYVSIKRKDEVDPWVLEHEPSEALFAGPDGMDCITTILEQAPAHLSQGATVYLECDPQQKEAIEKLVKNLSYKAHQFYKDQYGKYRYAILK